jgi:hypothetical protein
MAGLNGHVKGFNVLKPFFEALNIFCAQLLYILSLSSSHKPFRILENFWKVLFVFILANNESICS